jgi:hypothetical protein
VPDLSFSSDALRTAAQYLGGSSPATEVTPPTGDPCSRVYAQRISGPINDLNEEETAIQDKLKATYSNMLATQQSFEVMESSISDSIASALKGNIPW